jgi:anti-anti-sigma factor
MHIYLLSLREVRYKFQKNHIITTVMAIQSETREKVLIISPSGEFNKNAAFEMRELLDAAIDENVFKIVFDFSRLTQISSDGLRVVLESAKKLRKLQGRVAIVGLGDRIRGVFEVGGFFSLFDEFDTVDAAMAAINDDEPS